MTLAGLCPGQLLRRNLGQTPVQIRHQGGLDRSWAKVYTVQPLLKERQAILRRYAGVANTTPNTGVTGKKGDKRC